MFRNEFVRFGLLLVCLLTACGGSTPPNVAATNSDAATSDAAAACAQCTSEDSCRNQPCATEGATCAVAPFCTPYVGHCQCTSGRWQCTSTDCPRRDF